MKAYTDIEQSKKLAEIIPLESADMHYPDYYFDGNAKGPCNTPYKEAIEDLFHVYINPKTKRLLPCWSLAALLDVLPKKYYPIKDHNTDLTLGKPKDKWCVLYWDATGMQDGEQALADNPVDACVAMIEKLHELKML